jgi:hypothetical protein
VGEVARGGEGVILDAWDADLRRPVAMKALLEKRYVFDLRDAGQGERFLDEAYVTGPLDQPGVVPVHELSIDEGGRAFFTIRPMR